MRWDVHSGVHTAVDEVSRRVERRRCVAPGVLVIHPGNLGAAVRRQGRAADEVVVGTGFALGSVGLWALSVPVA
ncbi:hypothetical protein TSO5_18695 [Azospirillum sp. TSO5]|nr:hypothetical protein TSO5_18695 [Azospirillum sp. TSO5]